MDPQEAESPERGLQLAQGPHVHEALGAAGADVGVVVDRLEEEDVIRIDGLPQPGREVEQDACRGIGHARLWRRAAAVASEPPVFEVELRVLDAELQVLDAGPWSRARAPKRPGNLYWITRSGLRARRQPFWVPDQRKMEFDFK